MTDSLNKIAFGGGCHWCTEAVFKSLTGVNKVEQGFVASTEKNKTFSEAVIVHFEAKLISLNVLITIHLHTHNSTSSHALRYKYRSAVYTYSENQAVEARQILSDLQYEFDQRIITGVYPFFEFKPSDERFIDYYFKNPSKPFCKKYIDPKLRLLLSQFTNQVKVEILAEAIKP